MRWQVLMNLQTLAQNIYKNYPQFRNTINTMRQGYVPGVDLIPYRDINIGGYTPYYPVFNWDDIKRGMTQIDIQQ